MTEAIRVLVIDDDAAIRLLCRVNLEAEGMEVIEAGDGPSGLELAREPQPVVSRRHRGDSMPLLGEVVLEDLAKIGLVFDHQDSGHEASL